MKSKTLTDEQWVEVIKDVRAAKQRGLKVNEYCREQGIDYKDYTYRQTKLAGLGIIPFATRGKKLTSKASAGFVQFAPVNGNGHIEVQVGTAKINVNKGDKETLQWVLEAVKGLHL